MSLEKKFLTREQRILLALWRKAFRNPEERVAIVLSTKSLAISVRLNLYRAIRPFREELLFDDELRKAAEGYIASPRELPDGTWEVSLLPRRTLTELDAQLIALGIAEDDLLLPEEKIDMSKLLEFIQADAPKPSSTDFYDRG